MKFSEELVTKIKTLFDNKELQDRLLAGDPDAIREIGSISQKGISPEEVITAYDNGEIEALYKKSKMMVELQRLYKELCLEYGKATRSEQYIDR